MNKMIMLDEPLNPEIDNISSFIKEYQNIQTLKKELEIREKIYKNFLLKNLSKDKNNPYKDEDYSAYIIESEMKRVDLDWIKNYFKEKSIEIPLKKTKYEKLNIKRNK